MNILNNAIYLARNDIRAMYRKTVLGPLWPILLNLIGVLGMSMVWAELMGQPMRTFIPNLSLGMIVWQFIAGVIATAPTSLTQYNSIIRNIPIAPEFFVMRALARQTLMFLHNVPIIALIIVAFGVPVTWATLLVIPGLILVVLNAFWITYVFGLIGARMRDLQHMITALLPILFFVTPVMFRADAVSGRMQLVLNNPLTYAIEAFRMPLTGQPPLPGTYTVLIGGLLLGGLLTTTIRRRYAQRLPFWV